jgi:hypothetical protein
MEKTARVERKECDPEPRVKLVEEEALIYPMR